ncbi:MAG: PBSX family phage terminase large subunit [Elusimicrobiaceae bacterium]|nr:PBSX family phage terminase large subunit [Elusimicrobiaceae bacterium]
MSITRVFITPVFERNLNAAKKTVVNIGGARSSKSHSVAQLLIMKACNERNKNIGVARKTRPALKMTAERLVLDLLRQYGLYNPAAHAKTDHYYELNGNRMQFFSLDDPEKIKSAEFNYLWLEEANEFTYEDYLILLTRLSGKTGRGEKNRMFLTLNPSDSTGWIPAKLLQQPEVEVIRSSYRDNPFVQSDYIAVLESLKEQDENAYRVYALGEWGREDNTVFSNYTFTDAFPETADDTVWGVDFGFNNPSAVTEVRVKDRELHIREALYETRLTTAGIITALESLIPHGCRHQCIYADSAEPDRIQEIAAAGFNVFPAEKSVSLGIDALKRFRLNILKESVNLAREIKSYRWKKDLNGQVLDEPVKFNDHALDALRYAVYSHVKNGSLLPAVTVF